MSASATCHSLPSPVARRAPSHSPAVSSAPDAARLSALFDRRVQPYRARIRGYLRRHVDAESAEDLTQDVMLAAWRGLPHLHDLQALERWLFCVAAHQVATFYRRRNRQVQSAFPAAQAAGSSAAQASGVSLAALTGERMLHYAPALPDTRADARDQNASSRRFRRTFADTGGEAASASRRDTEMERVEARMWAEELLEQARLVCSQAQWQTLRGYYAGASFEEIGAQMRVDSATVRSHFRRGRACLLSHLVQHAPDLAGGQESIADVAQRLNSEAAGTQRLNASEQEALRAPCRHVKAHRAVCLKIAPHLPLPL